MGDNAKSWEQGTTAWFQIRANLFKKDGCRGQISSVGRKLLYEINPRYGQVGIATTKYKYNVIFLEEKKLYLL
jgi:hypothetical protein